MYHIFSASLWNAGAKLQNEKLYVSAATLHTNAEMCIYYH